MKNKTKKLLVASLCIAGLSLLAFGCGKGNSTPNVTGFEVAAEKTVEIGQYYAPEIPTVTQDGEQLHVSVTAIQGDKELYFNGDNALLVESFDDIQIIYTVECGTQTLEKSTLVRVQDTTAPYIVTSSLPEKIYRGEPFDYEDYIRVGDLSGTCTSSIKITDETGKEIAAENGEIFLSEDSTVTEVTFTVNAADGKNNTAEKTVKLPVEDLPYYTNPFDFDTIDISKVTSQFKGTTVEKTEHGGENAVKISASVEWKNESLWSAAHFTLPQDLSDYAFYDYMKVTASAESNCDIVVYGAGTEFKAGDTSVKEMIYDISQIKNGNANVIREEKYRVNIALLCGRNYESVPERAEIDFYVYDIEFGFYERQVSNESVLDLSAFGVEATEVISAKFTPTGGEEKTLDIATYSPTENGKLVLTVKKTGYRTTTFVIDIIPVSPPVDEDADKDTDVGFIW